MARLHIFSICIALAPLLSQSLAKDGDSDQMIFLQHVLATRVSPKASMAKSMVPTFRQGISRIAQEWNFNKHSAVLVTACDFHYKDLLVPWSQRLQRLGLRQQVIVTLDNAAAQIARSHGLPALNRHGKMVSPELAPPVGLVELAAVPLELAELFATVNLLVPMLLLEMNFDRVIFSEMDVFLFQNPVPYIDSATFKKFQGGYSGLNPSATNLLSMRSICNVPEIGHDSTNHGCANETNIGFMQLQGRDGAILLRNVLSIWSETSRKRWDQAVFNDELHRELAGHAPHLMVGLLPSPRFAVHPWASTAETVVMHFTWQPLPFRLKLLQLAYGGASPQELVRKICDLHPKTKLVGRCQL